VAEFNAAAQQFPAVLFAGMFGFRQREFFDVGESERAVLDVAPKVAF
jgi:LemA protein